MRLVHSLQHPNIPSSDKVTRRNLLLKIASVSASATIISFPAAPANAARGAAELDFEYYMRDLVGGNKKEGNVESSKAPPMAPPRTLKGPLLPLLLNKECSPSCIPVQALMDTIPQSSKNIAQDIQLSVASTKDKTAKSFRAKAPWQTEEICDQYYLDFTCYALWKTAAALLPNALDRDAFVRLVGRRLVAQLQEDGLLSKPKSGNAIVDSIPAVNQLLQLFQSSGYCKSFRIRTSDDVKDDNNSIPLFDELDDESLQIGGTVDCL
ncbi:MAG: hypothetical protein SGARI_006765, partial [Bacillariaceae sp.]